MAHQASRWQIAASGTAFDADTGFASTVYDSGEDTVNLVSLADAGPLVQGTAYEASVSHQSDTDEWSQWAEPVEFATLHAYTIDAESGHLSLSGAAASLLLHRVLVAEPGALAPAGADATLTWSAEGPPYSGTLTLATRSPTLVITDA